MKVISNSQVSLAKTIIAQYDGIMYGIYGRGCFAILEDGKWKPISQNVLEKEIHKLDGAEVEQGGGRVSLSNSAVLGIVRCIRSEVSVDAATWMKRIPGQ